MWWLIFSESFQTFSFNKPQRNQIVPQLPVSKRMVLSSSLWATSYGNAIPTFESRHESLP